MSNSRRAIFAAWFLLHLSTAPNGLAQTAQQLDPLEPRIPLIEVVIAGGLRHPWSVAFLPDGEFLVTERNGGIVRVAASGEKTPVTGVPEDLDNISRSLRDNTGLWDLALHPDFATNGRIYFTYATSGRDGTTTRLATARLAGNRLETVRTLFDATPRSVDRYHYGGALMIGQDRLLYMSVGERHYNEIDNPPLPSAQDPTDRRGKIYRFTLEGAPAPGNPRFGSDAPPGMFATGVRSPQGMTQNPATGDIWFTDHGSLGGDELNLLEAGANYGWPVEQFGRYRQPGYRPERTLGAVSYRQPVYTWGERTVAPTGVAYYTGTAFPEWQDDLIVAGLLDGHLMRVDLDGTGVRRVSDLMAERPVRLRNVRQAPDGALYILTDEQNGKLIRLERGR